TVEKNNNIILQKNVGYNLYDYFSYIIDNYDKLPNCIAFVKGNVFPRHVSKEFFDRIINNTFFTPIEENQIPTVRWPLSFFSPNGGYCEINNDWYLKHHKTKYFHSYNDFIKFCFVDPIIPRHIRFAPGANYIVPKKNIIKLSKQFYQNLKFIISYTQFPGEAHIIERALYTLWTSNFEINEQMLKPLDTNFIGMPKTKKIFSLVNLFSEICIKSINIYYMITKNKIHLKNIKLVKSFFMYIKSLIFYIKKLFEIINEFKQKKDWITKEEINNYRKKIKVYDVFTYNGEADILEIRLNILKDTVDQFIMVEAPTTFSGLNKPLYFEKQKERFMPFLNKIKYFVINDYPNDKDMCSLADASSNVPKNGPEHWRREFYQKESIKTALTHLNDDDICFISDVDEIWNPEIIIDYTKNDIFKLRQEVYTYYLNNKSSEPWAGTLITKYKNIKNNCLNHLRTKSKTKYVYLQNGGWHFTNIGGIEEIRRKLNDSYTEESYNTKEVQKNLDQRFGDKDYMGRNFKFRISENNLPKYILNNKNKYKKLFK
ncbi:MAG: DUF3431 domain-containing protein, partial [archaeon]|nr:DUF3431 domain-containing protein [archaeon]